MNKVKLVLQKPRALTPVPACPKEEEDIIDVDDDQKMDEIIRCLR